MVQSRAITRAAGICRSLYARTSSSCSPCSEQSGVVQGVLCGIRDAVDAVPYGFRQASGAAALAQDGPEITYPREGPGVSYALNWGLAAAGVPPSGRVLRNLKAPVLKEEGAASISAKTGTPVFALGKYAVGAKSISKAQFNRLFKEVSKHLSSLQKLYVHDAAVGSVTSLSAKLRAICDSPSGALAVQSSLEPTSTRAVEAAEFPLTAYVITNFSPASAKDLGLSDSSFVAVDYDRGAVILAGSAVADLDALKPALSALASAALLAEDAVIPFPGWIVASGSSTGIVVGPPSVRPALSSLALSSDVGAALGPSGVARYFPVSSGPSLYKAPSAVVIVTSDDSGAIPSVSKLSPSAAAYHFLAGYDGAAFNPAYSFGPSGADPVKWAVKVKDILSSSETSAYLLNTKELGGGLAGAVSSILAGAPPASKIPAESAVTALKEKYAAHIAKAFPNLPEGIAP